MSQSHENRETQVSEGARVTLSKECKTTHQVGLPPYSDDPSEDTPTPRLHEGEAKRRHHRPELAAVPPGHWYSLADPIPCVFESRLCIERPRILTSAFSTVLPSFAIVMAGLGLGFVRQQRLHAKEIAVEERCEDDLRNDDLACQARDVCVCWEEAGEVEEPVVGWY